MPLRAFPAEAFEWAEPGLSDPSFEGARQVKAGAGREQPVFRAGTPGVAVSCDAQCDAPSPDRIELLTRVIVLVAGMAIPEQERAVVLARVVAGVVGRSARCNVPQSEATTEPSVAS